MSYKIASNTLAQIGSKVGTAIISIFLLSLLTNYLSLELFGVYSKVYNYLGIFAFLADLGLYTIAVREVSRAKDEQETKKIIGNILTLRTLLGIGIAGLALLIAWQLPGYGNRITLISIAIISVFTIVSLINSSLLSLMQAKMQIEYSFFSTILGKLLNLGLIAGIIFLWFPAELYTGESLNFLLIMWAGVAGIVLNTWMNYSKASKLAPIQFLYDQQYISHIIKISLPYGLALFLSVVYFKIDVILLGVMEDSVSGNESIGLYSLPMKIVEVLMVMGGFYLNSLLPSLSKMFEEKKNILIQHTLALASKILLGAAGLVVSLGIVLRHDIIALIADETIYLSPQLLYSSADALIIVLCVILVYYISLLYIYIFIAAKKQGQLLRINLIVTLCNIVGNILIIPHYSFIGAGIVTVISQVILVGLCYVYTKKIISFKLPLGYISFITILALIMYYIGNTLIQDFPLGNLGNIVIYGGLLGTIYSGIIVLLLIRGQRGSR